MDRRTSLELFLAGPPGLEPLLAEEAAEIGLSRVKAVPGGVTARGGWLDVWTANLRLRGASRVLVRIGRFRATRLEDVDAAAQRLPWAAFLRRDVPVRLDVSARQSRLYHTGALAERIGTALARHLGVVLAEDAPVTVQARMDRDQCLVSVDTSGDLLHKRGFKRAVGKAPLRETLAALFLRACDYRGRGHVIDPMCGSGTILIEAAEIALGLTPGRERAFAFEHLAGFEPQTWEALRAEAASAARAPDRILVRGSDRDAGIIAAAKANAERAGLSTAIGFDQHTISMLQATDGPPGLVLTNPPYGARLGDASNLRSLYASLGRTLRERFGGWRVGVITSDEALARACDLPFESIGPPVPHGDLRIRLYQAPALPSP